MTAATDLLPVALDARARNTRQAWLLDNDAPGVDSLGEHIDELPRYGVPASVVRDMRRLLAEVVASNDLEGEDERMLAGSLETLAQRPVPARRMSDKELAAAIRRAQDAGTIDALIAETPRVRLTSRNLLTALRKTRAEALMRSLGPEASS